MLYFCAKFASMDICIDKRKSEIIYVDKANNHVADNSEVIKLINNCNVSIIDIYVKILAGINKLNDTEIEVLKYIMYESNISSYNNILNNVSKNINKSTTTVSRAINSLKDKKLIYAHCSNNIIVSNNIAISKYDVNNAKFLVIELNPKETSNGIDI